jgi:2-haloacid dehalogenase
MQRAAVMDPFPEAESALSTLSGAGLHVGVLTNSTARAAGAALAAAGLRERFEVVIGSDETQRFKPHPHVYEHGVERVNVDPGEIALVAAHACHVTGAMRAGLRGAWVARCERWRARSRRRGSRGGGAQDRL